MRIRKFRDSDAIKCSNIIKSNLLTINYKNHPKKTIESLIEYSRPKKLKEKSKTRNFFVAVDKDKILGIGGYSNDTMHTVFIKPTHHKKGIGKLLINHIIKQAKKDGIKIMRCPSSPYAVDFYKSLGFKKIKKVTDDYHNNTKITFILMKKKL